MALLEKIGAVRYSVTKWNEAKKFWAETIGLPAFTQVVAVTGPVKTV